MDEGKRSSGLVLAPPHGAWAAVHDAVVAAMAADGVELVWLSADGARDQPAPFRFHEYLNETDFVIADLTEANPTVMYEIGYSHARRMPVLPVVERRAESVPPALHGRLFFVYDQGNPEPLIGFISRWMRRYLAPSRVEERVG